MKGFSKKGLILSFLFTLSSFGLSFGQKSDSTYYHNIYIELIGIDSPDFPKYHSLRKDSTSFLEYSNLVESWINNHFEDFENIINNSQNAKTFSTDDVFQRRNEKGFEDQKWEDLEFWAPSLKIQQRLNQNFSRVLSIEMERTLGHQFLVFIGLVHVEDFEYFFAN